ncbi:MAG: tetratricopeptide repeat protein [Candidatus Magnetobacterium sp. LHC-1]
MSKKSEHKKPKNSDSTTESATTIIRRETPVFLSNPFFHVLIIAVVGLLIYSNTFEVPFVFDDKPNIIKNQLIRHLKYFTDNTAFESADVSRQVKDFFKTRFIGYLSLAMNYKLHALDVTGYHIFNLAVHITSAGLTYWLIILTLNSPFLSNTTAGRDTPKLYALSGALLFISHPIATQAVTYIIQRFASLATLFYLLSVVMYVRARACRSVTAQVILYVVSVLSAICAMKTKEIAFTIPLCIALYEFTFLEGGLRKRVAYLAPIMLTIVVIPLTLIGSRGALSDAESISRSIGIASAPDISRWDYLITQFRVIVTYIRLLFIPVNQNLDYDYPVYRTLFNFESLISLLFIASIVGLAVYLYVLSARANGKRILRLTAFGILWFFLTLSVEAGIIPIADVIFEHRLYLPLAGFCLVFVSVCIIADDKLKHRWIVPTAVTLIVLTLAVATYRRNNVWHDEISLWSDVAVKSPNKVRPQYDLGVFYERAGDYEKALLQYQRAIALNPNDSEAHYNMGNVYQRQGDFDAAIKHYQAALKLKPDYLEAHNNLGNIWFRQENYQQAIAEYQAVIKLNPDYAEAHNNLGSVYGILGRDDEAIKEFQAALRLNPDDIDARKNLELLLNTK